MSKVTVGEWTDALRSGNYEQAKGQLATHDGYCCLGVLCDLLNPDGWVSTKWGKDMEVEGANYPLGYLPPVSVTDQIQELLVNGQFNVTYMNDNGSSFEDIADHIESVYDKEYEITLGE